jgi:hypothetical protein
MGFIDVEKIDLYDPKFERERKIVLDASGHVVLSKKHKNICFELNRITIDSLLFGQ